MKRTERGGYVCKYPYDLEVKRDEPLRKPSKPLRERERCLLRQKNRIMSVDESSRKDRGTRSIRPL
jgi:hypothetical protein